MTEHAVARGTTWIVFAIFVAALVQALAGQRFDQAIVSAFVVVCLAGWASILDSVQRFADAKAGKMIAERTIAEVTLKVTQEAASRGQVRVDARLERTRAAN